MRISDKMYDEDIDEDISDEMYESLKIQEFKKSLPIVFGLLSLPFICLPLGVLITINICNKNDIKKYKTLVEDNVAIANPDINEFSTSAITVSNTDGEYFAELFGTAMLQSGATPVFTQLSYRIDEELFEDIKDYYRIQYTYDDKGNIIQAENVRRGGCADQSVVRNIFSRLAEVTQQRYDSINVIGETDEMNTAVENSVGADRLQIVNISKPRVADGYATFYMGVMRDNKLIQFGVEMPATADIALNPNSVYTRYMAGEGELVKLDEMNFSDYAHQSDNFRTIDFGDNV